MELPPLGLYEQNVKHQSGWTVWLTGLPAAGKSTLASHLARILRERGIAHEVLDGDEVRQGLCSDLGFSKTDRNENVRRLGYLAGLLNKHGVACIVAAISPFEASREEVRGKIPRFLQVYVDCPREVAIKRDPKGLYKRALNGEISDFTGVSDPYEPPQNPDVRVYTASETIEESVSSIVAALCSRGWLRVLDSVYEAATR